MKIKRFILLTIIISFWACSKETADNVVATYKNHELTKKEVESMLPRDISPEDSIQMVQQYIEEWAKNKIVLETSQQLLNDDEKLSIEEKVENYKNDLLINEIEMYWLNNDSIYTPSDDELREYYEEYAESFLADDDFVEYRFVEVPTSRAYTTRNLLKENNNEANATLDTLVKNNHYNAELRPAQWIKYSQLSQVTPLPKNAPAAIYLKKQVFNLPQENAYFLLQIVDFVKNGEPKPFPLAKKQIQSVLINKRKLNLLSDKKNELYEKALYNDEIKIK